ncbi:hypothetical protein KCP77_14705 [Salmonella enterica subsp. enterica]|nr:hypothetical protein KCP77_14705 [Salmonella enterica subsp. enterica]
MIVKTAPDPTGLDGRFLLAPPGDITCRRNNTGACSSYRPKISSACWYSLTVSHRYSPPEMPYRHSPLQVRDYPAFKTEQNRAPPGQSRRPMKELLLPPA